MDNDIHPSCFHCQAEFTGPIWPVTEIETWKLDVCYSEARIEQEERDYQGHLKDQSVWDLEQVKKASLRESKKKKHAVRDQHVGLPSVISNEKKSEGTLLTLKVEDVNMAKKETKTGMIDRLLKANLGNKEEGTGSYAKGAATTIAQEVLDASNAGSLDKSETLELKALKGLVFSRRAIVGKASREAATV